MSAIGSKLSKAQGGMVLFWCPGCRSGHQIRVDPAFGPAWRFNGNDDAPTFTPSILVQGTQRLSDDEYQRVMAGEAVETRPLVCHSFVTDGRIQFLGDSTHALAGQTVDLPEWPQ
ncbi:MAG: DUF6527 family protein [Alphaproteobacteria bacterium]